MVKRNLSKAEINKRKAYRRRLLITLGIAGSLYLGTPLFLGDMGILKYYTMLKTNQEISAEIQELVDNNKKLRREVQALRSDPDTIEQIAREKLGMVKKGERVYRFQPVDPLTP